MRSTLLAAVLSFVTGAGLMTLLMRPGTGARSTGRPPVAAPAPPRPGPVDAPPARDETTTYRAVTPTGAPAEWVEVELTGHRDRWHVRYPGPAGRSARPADLPGGGDPDTPAVVRVPADSDIRLTLKSRDFVYQLSLPQTRAAQVAVPDREFRLEFHSLSPGVFVLPGDAVCGPARPQLAVTVRVEPKPAFRDWLDRTTRAGDPPRGNGP